MSKESQLRKTNHKARLRQQGRLKRDADRFLLDAALTRMACKVADQFVPGLHLTAIYDETLKKAVDDRKVVRDARAGGPAPRERSKTTVIELKPNKDGVYE